MTLEGMTFEPIRTFNFRIEAPDELPEAAGQLFSLSVERAVINLMHKNGRIDVRDFSDSGQTGIDLIKFYMKASVPEFRINLLSPFGEVVRTYVLFNNRMQSATINMFNGPEVRRNHVTNSLFFEFEDIKILPGTESEIPSGVRVLELDYSKHEGPAELIY